MGGVVKTGVGCEQSRSERLGGGIGIVAHNLGCKVDIFWVGSLLLLGLLYER